MATGTDDRMDAVLSSAAVKVPCAVISTTNLTLSGEQTIDGITTSSSRVLVNGQTDQTLNGIYRSNSSAWTREPDFDGSRDAVTGTLVGITGGTYAGQFYRLTTADSTIVFGTSLISFTLAAVNNAAFIPTGSTPPTDGLYLSAAHVPAIAANSQPVFKFKLGGAGGNWIESSAAAAGGVSYIGSNGSDTTGAFGIVNLGQAAINFYTAFNVLQAQIKHTASAVNFPRLEGGASGTSPGVSCQGSGADLDWNVTTKGAGVSKSVENGVTKTMVGTCSVQGSGDTNDSSAGSGSDKNHSLTFAIPSNFLTLGKAMRVTAHFKLTTGAAAPNLTHKLKLGSTTIADHTAVTPGNGISNDQYALSWILQARSAPGASANIECAPISVPTAGSTNTQRSSVDMPVTAATNGALTLQVATLWSAAGTGTNTVALDQLIVEVLN